MTWTLEVRNIGGIRTGSAHIEPGVNALRAENWQGKSSLLAAIKTAMGIDSSLMEGADHGCVILSDNGDTYRVELRRENGTITRSGNPYLGSDYDRVCADLFAALDETNAVRHTVRERENLESVLTYPLDFENIDRKIEDRQSERERVEAALESAEAAVERLPEQYERVEALEADLADLREQKGQIDAEESGTSLEEKREALSDRRAERERIRDRIERLERAVERTEATLAEKRSELDSLSGPAEDDLEERIEAVREEYDRLERDRTLLQQVYTANKRLLEEGRVDLVETVEHGLLGDSATCWVCGNEAEVATIETRLQGLRETLSSLQSQADEYEDQLAELERTQADRRQKRQERRDLEREIPRLERTLSDRAESLATARDRLESVSAAIDTLESTVEDIDETRTDLESEIKYAERELAAVEETIAELEDLAEEAAALDEQRESLTEEIRELRGRKDAVKRRTQEAFDEAMNSILDRFDTGFESARMTAGFDLLVAREGREVSLDALSQGELELLGIVAALAGHEAYDVGETTPVLLLDDLGRLSDRNVDQLVSYLSARAEYLVFTSYPEHSSFHGSEIVLEHWSVVSGDLGAESTG